MEDEIDSLSDRVDIPETEDATVMIDSDIDAERATGAVPVLDRYC
jgi:hypothetical protein